MKHTLTCSRAVYQNSGNVPLLRLIPPCRRVLDCGCGSGDNARLLTAREGCTVIGITISPSEQETALAYCAQVYLADLEQGIPEIVGNNYDVVIMSHVLEHLVHPENLLRDTKRVLAANGLLAVALPNVLNYRERWNLLRGRFEYRSGGVMDATHIRFYTFTTGRRLLVDNGFEVIIARADGSFPLWKLRSLVPTSFDRRLSQWVCTRWPGLFGTQSLYLARLAKGTG